MRSLFIAVCLALTVALSAMADTNTWVAPISVVQTATTIKLNTIQISILPDGKVAVIVQWSWLNAAGNVIRSGATRYTEAEIAAKLTAKGSSVDQFRALFLAIAAEEAVAP